MSALHCTQSRQPSPSSGISLENRQIAIYVTARNAAKAVLPHLPFQVPRTRQKISGSCAQSDLNMRKAGASAERAVPNKIKAP